MNTIGGRSIGGRASSTPSLEQPSWQRVPAVPVALICLFLAFTLFPPVRDNPRLLWAFLGTGAALVLWSFILWARLRRQGRSFRVESLAPLKSHYIQASVQSCLYVYWGWYWGSVYSEVSLILAQLVFLYTVDGLLSWSRGRSWRPSFGPLPIIFSTNFFLWFKEDWFVFQFLMVASGAFAKEFIKWERDGRKTHIFNPSSFGLALFSIILITTGTSGLTWVQQIADTFDKPPEIYLVIFLLGLVVQFFFSTTLMTLSAVVALCVLNWIYKSSAGTYFFVFSNIPAAVFLGLHLLMTDPATSPRSNSGKVVFGLLYGIGVFACFVLLTAIGAPTVYDKLLPVPLLNLGVPWIERFAARGPFGAFDRWSVTLQARRLNLLSMSAWVALFMTLLGSGYVQGKQEGATVEYWNQACLEGKPGAARGLVAVLTGLASENNAAAWNELGMVYLEGKFVERDANAALHDFAKASKLGNLAGSANLATMFLQAEEAPSSKVVEMAFAQLEEECAKGAEGPVYFLVGRAYETGRARQFDPVRALIFYEQGCRRGNQDACTSAARLAVQPPEATPANQ